MRQQLIRSAAVIGVLGATVAVCYVNALNQTGASKWADLEPTAVVQPAPQPEPPWPIPQYKQEQQFDCEFALTDVASKYQVWHTITGEYLATELGAPTKKDYLYKINYIQRQVLAAGQEYVQHAECTEERGKVQEIVKDMRELLAKTK
jgi:hypothetical protein